MRAPHLCQHTGVCTAARATEADVGGLLIGLEMRLRGLGRPDRRSRRRPCAGKQTYTIEHCKAGLAGRCGHRSAHRLGRCTRNWRRAIATVSRSPGTLSCGHSHGSASSEGCDRRGDRRRQWLCGCGGRRVGSARRRCRIWLGWGMGIHRSGQGRIAALRGGARFADGGQDWLSRVAPCPSMAQEEHSLWQGVGPVRWRRL